MRIKGLQNADDFVQCVKGLQQAAKGVGVPQANSMNRNTTGTESGASGDMLQTLKSIDSKMSEMVALQKQQLEQMAK